MNSLQKTLTFRRNIPHQFDARPPANGTFDTECSADAVRPFGHGFQANAVGDEHVDVFRCRAGILQGILDGLRVAAPGRIRFGDAVRVLAGGEADELGVDLLATLLPGPDRGAFRQRGEAAVLITDNKNADSVLQLRSLNPSFKIDTYNSIQWKLSKRADGIIETCKSAVTIAIGLIGIMTLFMGFMSIAERAGGMRLLSRIIGPFFSKLLIILHSSRVKNFFLPASLTESLNHRKYSMCRIAEDHRSLQG